MFARRPLCLISLSLSSLFPLSWPILPGRRGSPNRLLTLGHNRVQIGKTKLLINKHFLASFRNLLAFESRGISLR